MGISTKMPSIPSPDIWIPNQQTGAVPTFEPRPSLANPWHLIHFRCLHDYERVSDQFHLLGVLFEDAIAVRPSNPAFIRNLRHPAIMPTARCKGLKLWLEQPIRQLQVVLMGYRSVTLTTFNGEGHSTACFSTPECASSALAPHPAELREQVVTLEVSAACLVRIDAKAPFVVTKLGLQR
ncbi:MAG: hypothetical protein IGR92_11690 [Leptolyngbyaceae cyanobacterium T60_A2020_046]|nr:hypothetical protein [Leptolyngbyaceae cyanobacterium T60_A2020_046]